MSEKFHCRMYENELPKVDDVVMVNVRQIADMGAYVKLVCLQCIDLTMNPPKTQQWATIL